MCCEGEHRGEHRGHHGHHLGGPGWHHPGGCCCGCRCAPAYGPRRFFTREEVIARLEEYLKELKAEAAGVEERIAELRKECCEA